MVSIAAGFLTVLQSCNCFRQSPFFLPNCWVCVDFVPFSSHHPYFTMIGDHGSPECSPSLVRPQIFVERTLAIIKPDAIHKANEIEDIIVRSGFTILQRRRVQLTPEEASSFYAEHFGKLFYPSLVSYMSSGPSVVFVLARQEGISYWRKLLGPTNARRARETHPDSPSSRNLLRGAPRPATVKKRRLKETVENSIRALYGTDEQRNAAHGSDNYLNAEREIRFFFHDSVMEPIATGQAAQDYLAKAVNPTLLKGLTEMCKNKPLDPVIWLADWLLDHNPYKPRIEKDSSAAKTTSP